jgi:excisionase family DNA binding protein
MIIFNSPDSFSNNPAGFIFEKHISVQAAASYTGYNVQYLRRLLRCGKLDGLKVGQTWLISLASLDIYLEYIQKTADYRCGPKKSSPKGSAKKPKSRF